MSDLIRNAWIGWDSFKEPGKLIGLLLVVVVFLCLYKESEQLKGLAVYTAVASALCICPVTAGLLMLYQTRFYDYQWIWSMVPVSICIAAGLTYFVTDFCEACRKKDRRYGWGILIAVPVVLFFCGGMGLPPGTSIERQADRQQAEQVLWQIRQEAEGDRICLWGPKEILQYAREYDGGMELLYGRNMWEEALNAYTFDTYTEDELAMYRWMDGEGPEDKISDEECVRLLEKTEVNCVLLSPDAEAGTIDCFEDAFGREAVIIENYYVWIL